MKRLLTLTLAALFGCGQLLFGQVFTEASDLTLVGKLMPTPNPYHRVDTVKYKGFTKGENKQVRCPAGVAVAFKTNSTAIWAKATGDLQFSVRNTMQMAYVGFDLYIRKNGEWLWAGADCQRPKKVDEAVAIVKHMAPGEERECLMYLPMYSDVSSVVIGIDEGCYIQPLENPFRHRVAIFGSSFTQGISVSRSGMAYPSQFSRHTGIQMLNLGCSGNCKMQPYFADVLADVEADAFVFDAFSNPSAEMIEERLFPFIEKVQAAHPGKPLIFQQTIYRERRNFDTKVDASEAAKQHVADSLMKIAVKKYKDVYFIGTNATSKLHESSVDGTHPDNYGYYLWSRSIEKPILKILKKYGLK